MTSTRCIYGQPLRAGFEFFRHSDTKNEPVVQAQRHQERAGFSGTATPRTSRFFRHQERAGFSGAATPRTSRFFRHSDTKNEPVFQAQRHQERAGFCTFSSRGPSFSSGFLMSEKQQVDPLDQLGTTSSPFGAIQASFTVSLHLVLNDHNEPFCRFS